MKQTATHKPSFAAIVLKYLVPLAVSAGLCWLLFHDFDFDGERERTISFGLPGTIFSSRHSFYAGLPSYYRVEACCDSVVLKVLKADYVGLIERNPRFAIWALHYAWCEQFYNELRQATVHNGTAEERYRHMLRTRPELTEAVSQRVIASYLGVTPEYLCRLKRRLLKSGLR